MKKVISLVIVLSMVLSCFCAVPVFAEEVASGTCGTAVSWVLDDAGTLTVSGTGEMETWASSSKTPWYSYKSSVKKVVIGEGVTSVSDDSFWNYDNIAEVELSSTVKTIGSWAFSSCDALTEVTIPSNVEFIDMMAFYGVSVIKGYTYSAAWSYAMDEEVTFVSLGEMPEAVLSSGECGSGVTYSLTNRGVLTVSGQGEISSYEYEEAPWWPYMETVLSVVMEEGITVIGAGAFNGLINVQEITIPEGVTDIGEMAFYGCWKTESLTLPSTVKTIGNDAFNSVGITTLVIPDGTTTIGDYAFAGAPLESVAIPESVVAIGAEAFGDGYTSCTITGVKGSYAEEYASEYGYPFEGSFAEPIEGTFGENLTWVLGTDGTFTLSGTGEMPYYSQHWDYPWYDYEDSIKHIVVEAGVQDISGRAFYACSNLKSVTISYTVTSIGNYAFYAAPSDCVFKGYTDTAAERYATNNNYSFESLGAAPCYELAGGSCGENVKWSLDNYGKLTISGEGAMENYSSTSSQPWYDYSYTNTITSIVVEEGVTGVGDYVFASLYDITQVTLPESLMSIGNYAFAYVDQLNSIVIPLKVVSIGEDAFYSCSLTIKGYTPSAAQTFAEDNGFTFESVGEAPREIIASGICGENLKWTLDNYGLMKIDGTGEMSYSDGSSSSGSDAEVEVMSVSSSDVPWASYRKVIKTVEISNGVTNVAAYAFYNCTALSMVTLPESITTLGEYCFYGCSSLKEILLHYNVVNIDYYAFNDNRGDFSTYYGLVIKGYSGSEAEEYATKQNISFESVGEAPLMVFASGNLTDTITWEYYNNRILVISGSGEIPDYGYNPTLPWSDYKNKIEKIEINGDISYIGNYFIGRYSSLTEIIVGEGVQRINEYAFRYAEQLEKITLPATLQMMSGNSLPSNSEIIIAGYENTYAQSYAEKTNYVFESLGELETETVYVNTVEALIDAIASNRTIIIEDGIYLLDETFYSDEYPYEYIDQITIRNVSNLTIKARNAGMVEIIAAQQNDSSTAPLVFQSTYGVTIEGIRIGNMAMKSNNGSWVGDENVSLMGGYDDYGLSGFEGISVSTYNGDSANIGYPTYMTNKVALVDCDIFNSTYGISFYSGTLTVDGCTIRDNARCGLYAMYADVIVKDTVFSANGSNETYRSSYCINVANCNSFQMDGCTFINNSNPYCIDAYGDNAVNCVYSNNVFDSQTVKAFGLTENGITWYVTAENGENVLKLGYSINADNMTIDSAEGMVYPYSVISAPWANFEIDSVDAAPGVEYDSQIWGACGVNVTWQFNRADKTLVLSAGGLSRARTALEYGMSDISSDCIWGDYSSEIENIEISDNITGVYNSFENTAYYRNEDNWENSALYVDDILLAAKDNVSEIVVREGTRIIADGAFTYLDNLTSVVIPEGVEYIGVVEKLGENQASSFYGVFADCRNLKSMTIPVSVTQFDHAMFYGCDNLSDIYYSGTMAQWEEITVGDRNDQLDYCNIHCSDGTIEVPDFEYTVYDDYVVIDAVLSKDAEIIIPKEIEGLPVKEVYYNAFEDNTTVTSVVVEASLNNMFSLTGCIAVESITLPQGLYLSNYMISDTAFYKNKANWTDGYLYHNNCLVDISEDIKGKVVIDNVEAIGGYVFSEKPYITEVVIADGIKMMGGEFFYNCESLEAITLPDTFTTGIWISVDSNCGKLKNIYMSENNPYYISVNGVVYSKDKSTLVHMPVGRTGSYTISDGTVKIGEWAFIYSALSTLTIPASVTAIGQSAFETCDIADIYYLGTQDQWENDVEIGRWNDHLNVAEIHIGELATPAVTAKKDGNKIIVDVIGFEDLGTVYITGVQNKTTVDVEAYIGDGSYELEGDAEYVKVFVWESLKSMRPVIDPVIAEIE